jgi:hypothetical protein
MAGKRTVIDISYGPVILVRSGEAVGLCGLMASGFERVSVSSVFMRGV